MDLTGTWDVISSPDFDDDYLHMEGQPYVKLQQKGNRVEGEYQLGLQSGGIDGRLKDDGSVLFSFEGMDEMDAVDGDGAIVSEGDRLTLTLMYHDGDDYTFVCERRR